MKPEVVVVACLDSTYEGLKRPSSTRPLPTWRKRLDSTYEGLKLTARGRGAREQPGLDSIYEGLKPRDARVRGAGAGRLDSTYEGLKRHPGPMPRSLAPNCLDSTYEGLKRGVGDLTALVRLVFGQYL